MRGKKVFFWLVLVWAAAPRWPYTHSTPNYDIHTDTSPEFARLIGMHMETMHREYARLFARHGEVDVRSRVYVFARRDDLAELHGQMGGTGHVAGFYSGRRNLIAAHADGYTREDVLRTLYHEGLHLFVHHALDPWFPLWLNEGMAVYFQYSTWDGQRFVVGEVPTHRLTAVQRAIREGTYIPFEKLFVMENAEWRARGCYSEAWSVVHFLAHGQGGRYAQTLDEFLRQSARRISAASAFRNAFGRRGPSLGELERQWVHYVMNLQPTPKYRCRQNLRDIMFRAGRMGRVRRDAAGIDELRRAMIEYYGQQQTAEINRLFRCPFDHSPRGASYVLARRPQDGDLMLVCLHRPGTITTAYTESGRLSLIRIEEEARELVSPETWEAIRKAATPPQ